MLFRSLTDSLKNIAGWTDFTKGELEEIHIKEVTKIESDTNQNNNDSNIPESQEIINPESNEDIMREDSSGENNKVESNMNDVINKEKEEKKITNSIESNSELKVPLENKEAKPLLCYNSENVLTETIEFVRGEVLEGSQDIRNVPKEILKPENIQLDHNGELKEDQKEDQKKDIKQNQNKDIEWDQKEDQRKDQNENESKNEDEENEREDQRGRRSKNVFNDTDTQILKKILYEDNSTNTERDHAIILIPQAKDHINSHK